MTSPQSLITEMQLFTREGFFFPYSYDILKIFFLITCQIPSTVSKLSWTVIQIAWGKFMAMYLYTEKCKPLVLRRSRILFPCIKAQSRGAEVPALPPSITMDATKLWCFLYKPESERVPQLDCVMLNRLLNNLCLSVCEPGQINPLLRLITTYSLMFIELLLVLIRKFLSTWNDSGILLMTLFVSHTQFFSFYSQEMEDSGVW